MAAIQGLTRHTSTVLDAVRMQKAYHALLDLKKPRPGLMLKIFAEQDMSQTGIERELHRRGDKHIRQSVASRTMKLLLRHRLILFKHYDGHYYYYGINAVRIHQINTAIARLFQRDDSITRKASDDLVKASGTPDGVLI